MKSRRLFSTLVLCLAMQPIYGVSAQSMMRSTHDNHLIESYVAYISNNDLFNSSGDRLTQPWQIIRQDRANFHRFGLRDPGDESDSFFASAKNRAIMEQMLANGRISPQAALDVIRGGALVLVQIFGSGSIGRCVVVTTAH
ncbi:hypothetical protein SAZ10_15705 [Mesorhizobium sp. BAC0120]|uniref:hypothetical protein n=1 Tax=Mesorhizobium sp. BAC0120 TaxID=3090670 RepID=UPI00298CCD96|nr:hypothetical protein [Mesorhizobium sp. BAC0120]MDW6023203.1 hypothetical protein [Mesorhizobium sp. BAC0120]